MRKLLLTATLWFVAVCSGFCVLPVEDYALNVKTAVDQIQNYARYLETNLNQITQITNQVTQIENQVTQLERFGNPQTYVNLLHLDDFVNTAAVLRSGIGQTISAYQQAANGIQALSYTGNGLYSNLWGSVDRFGNVVQYQTDAFKKFGALNDMVNSYDTQQQTYNAQIASLQQQLTIAMQNLNTARTQMETLKYAAQINAIHAQINALTQTTNLTGQRVAVQQWQNQNDAARVQEATRQQLEQERATALQSEASSFGTLIGGQSGQLP